MVLIRKFWSTPSNAYVLSLLWEIARFRLSQSYIDPIQVARYKFLIGEFCSLYVNATVHQRIAPGGKVVYASVVYKAKINLACKMFSKRARRARSFTSRVSHANPARTHLHSIKTTKKRFFF